MSVLGSYYCKWRPSLWRFQWTLTSISLPVRHQRGRPTKDIWGCCESCHRWDDAECPIEDRPAAASTRRSGGVCGQEERREERRGGTEEWIQASQRLSATWKQQPYRWVDGGRKDNRWVRGDSLMGGRKSSYLTNRVKQTHSSCPRLSFFPTCSAPSPLQSPTVTQIPSACLPPPAWSPSRTLERGAPVPPYLLVLTCRASNPTSFTQTGGPHRGLQCQGDKTRQWSFPAASVSLSAGQFSGSQRGFPWNSVETFMVSTG